MAKSVARVIEDDFSGDSRNKTGRDFVGDFLSIAVFIETCLNAEDVEHRCDV